MCHVGASVGKSLERATCSKILAAMLGPDPRFRCVGAAMNYKGGWGGGGGGAQGGGEQVRACGLLFTAACSLQGLWFIPSSIIAAGEGSCNCSTSIREFDGCRRV